MTKQGHIWLALSLTPVAYYAAQESWLAIPFCIIGGIAPDWIEIPIWMDDTRNSIIPHRRITHWLLGSVLSLILAIMLNQSWLIGFFVGYLSHNLADYLNPMGIPTVHPWNRHSLRLMKSGKNEFVLVLLGFSLSGLVWYLATK